ncbi:hypothetical protein CPC08DRAFT_648946, partial [Agrocybe pediades]
MGSFEPLPNFPRTQALASETFSPPPLDGSILLPEMCDWHLQKSPNHPLFTYACQSGGIQTIYWVHAARAIHTGARIVRRTLGWNLGGKSADVIAILASSETISYYTLLMSIMRGGYTAFTISARNSPSAVAHLIKKIATGMVINAFEPKTPAVIPTPQNFIEGVVACKSDLVLCVPLFLEEWCKKPEHVQALTRISGAIYAGGPLSKQAGEYLTSKGVQLFNLYG